MKKKYLILICFLSPNDIYAQQNPIGNIIGGMLGAAIIQGVKTEWEKLPQLEQYCVNLGLQRDGTNINQLIQNGVGPSDQRLSPLLNGCRQFISRELRSNIQCQVNYNSKTYRSFCDEGYAENVGNNINRLSLEQAIELSFSNRPIQLGQFERPEAASRRQQMIGKNPNELEVPSPTFNCANATKQSEIAICNSYELTILDIQKSNYWQRAKSFDKSGLVKKELIKANNAITKCQSDIGCIKGVSISEIDSLAIFLKSSGDNVESYTEKVDRIKREEEARQQAELEQKRAEEAKAAAEQQRLAAEQAQRQQQARAAYAAARAEAEQKFSSLNFITIFKCIDKTNQGYDSDFANTLIGVHMRDGYSYMLNAAKAIGSVDIAFCVPTADNLGHLSPGRAEFVTANNGQYYYIIRSGEGSTIGLLGR